MTSVASTHSSKCSFAMPLSGRAACPAAPAHYPAGVDHLKKRCKLPTTHYWKHSPDGNMHRITWQPYVLGALVTVISTGMLLYGWDNIPDTYATHFTTGGEANGFTNKGPEVFFGQYMAVGILTLGLALALPDTLPLPKKTTLEPWRSSSSSPHLESRSGAWPMPSVQRIKQRPRPKMPQPKGPRMQNLIHPSTGREGFLLRPG